MSSTPSTWLERCEAVRVTAEASGAVRAVNAETAVCEELIGGERYNFAVKFVRALADKPRGDAGGTDGGANGNSSSSSSKGGPENKRPFNPFASPETILVVGEYRQRRTAPADEKPYVVMLNKYAVVPCHALLIPKEFEPQHEGPEAVDLAAMAWACDAFSALVFYNCGPDSGASQPHRHMQVVPLPFDSALGDPLPMQILLERTATGLKARDFTVFFCDALPFANAACMLPASSDAGNMDEARLGEAFAEMKRIAGVETGGSYNLLMTKRAMWLVPRRQEDAGEVSVNSFGFAGSVLTKTESGLAEAKRVGVLKILEAVATPKQS
jgi:sulfate adenylyltransferase (ADP) / ATP adenylyltransferase